MEFGTIRMTLKTFPALAKVNLTLKVHGRRPDGYHELSSVVVFAKDVFDIIRIAPGEPSGLDYTGPFSSELSSLAGADTVSRAFNAARRHAPELTLGAVEIEKHIPLASGLGGGSADAAAVLRALQKFNPEASADIDWVPIAAEVGADVAVCLASRAQVMTGIGDRVAPIDSLPPVYAVLIRPDVAGPDNKTKEVFAALNAPSVDAAQLSSERVSAAPPVFQDVHKVADFVCDVGNDLMAPARHVMPALEAPLATLQADPRCLVASLSGAGPTVFGLFQTQEEARLCADRIGAAHPTWWVRATALV